MGGLAGPAWSGLVLALSGRSAGLGLLAGRPVDQLPYDIQMPDVPRILLQQMGENPTKRGWIAGESATQQGSIGQLSLAGNRLGAGGNGCQLCGQVGNCVFGRNEPTLRVGS